METNLYPLLNLATSTINSQIQKEFILNDVQINTLIHIILTLNISITRHAPEIYQELTINQLHSEKLCLFITNPITQTEFVAISYSPSIFRQIRLISGITQNDFQTSFGFDHLLEKLVQCDFGDLKGSSSTGKSNSIFYFSFDKRFIIRTINKSEYLLLKEILPSYYEFITQNPHSLIIRFYEFSKLRLRNDGNTKKVYFVVINNVFYNSKSIHQCYDIKGSLHCRTSQQQSGKSVIYKEQDFLESGQSICLQLSLKISLLDQIILDTEFLSSLGLIDYSLIIGIHKISPEEEDSVLTEKYRSIDSKEVYYLGIIDILTRYNTLKKVEYIFKGGLFGFDQISCNPPEKYQQRFLDFMQRVFM